MSHDGRETSINPLTLIDHAGLQQNIKVIEIGDITNPLVAGYSYVEATGSTLEIISGSNEKLNLIHERAVAISSSLLPLISDISSSINSKDITTSEQNKQSFNLTKATNIYSKVFTINDLYFLTAPKKIDLHIEPLLNPNYLDVSFRENYILKATDIIIQNSTNRNVYLKISYDPFNEVNYNNYTIKIPPGSLYSSEEKTSHIRHKILIEDPYYGAEGELVASIVYNTALNEELIIGKFYDELPTLTSLAINVYSILFDTPKIITNFYFQNNSLHDSIKINGQEKITTPGQSILLYVEDSSGARIYPDSGAITGDSPTDFNILLTSLPTDNYVLKAETAGVGNIGDAIVLYADLIKFKN